MRLGSRAQEVYAYVYVPAFAWKHYELEVELLASLDRIEIAGQAGNDGGGRGRHVRLRPDIFKGIYVLSVTHGLELVKSFIFNCFDKLSATSCHYAAVFENMHDVGLHILQKLVVVGYDYGAALGAS